MINSCFYESPIGILCISEQNGKIKGLCLQQEEADFLSEQEEACLYFRQEETGSGHGTSIQKADSPSSCLLWEACIQLDEYFQGRRKQFDLPLCCEGTAFQRRVWSQLQKIPYGETRNYEEIAVAVGSPRAHRAVGQANHRNPIMIIVPCHRVLRKNGDLGGFACGIAAKRHLLELEAGVRQRA